MRWLPYLGILLGVVPSISFGESAGPVPIWSQLNQVYSGRVAAFGYFTPAQEADPAWEAMRVGLAIANGRGPRRHVIRRDVRWFAPAKPGDRPCARIVYSMEEAGRDGQSTVNAHRTEIDRLTLLAMEPFAPMQAGCGINDPSPSQPIPDTSEMGEEGRRAETMRTTGLRCDAVQHDPATPIRIYPATRLWIRTAIDRALPEAQQSSTIVMLARTPEGVIASRSWRAFRPGPPAINFGTLTDDRQNILIDQRFARSQNGDGYCVQLTARQGGRVWSRTADRPIRVAERNGMTGVLGLSRNADHDWAPSSDGLALAEMLASDLGIPKLPPLPN